jgi:hypothetical protein
MDAMEFWRPEGAGGKYFWGHGEQSRSAVGGSFGLRKAAEGARMGWQVEWSDLWLTGIGEKQGEWFAWKKG